MALPDVVKRWAVFFALIFQKKTQKIRKKDKKRAKNRKNEKKTHFFCKKFGSFIFFL